MPITVKNSVQFPEIGQIRKGGVMTKSQDPSQTRPGKDLNEKFRVLFFPGNETSAEKFIAANPGEGLFPTRIKAMLPFQRLDDCWVVYNEAYSAGRMLARADGEKYITLRDGQTGEYIISNGAPYKPFTVGDVVSYTGANGKRQNIKIKPVGKLYLFLPVLDRAVYMTLKTTSFYDALNIQGQLNAIESIAAGLNRGSVQGINIWIYRRPQMITWNKPDGSAVRVEKWLINIEIDVEWMKRAAERMSRFALGEGADAPALPASIAGTIDPDEEDEHEDVTEGSFVDTNTEPETTIVSPKPATPTASVVQTAPQKMSLEMAEAETNSKGIRYGDLDTETLSHMANALETKLRSQALTADERETKRFKRDACLTILASRANG